MKKSILILIFCAIVVQAQENRFLLSGVVNDSSGNPLPFASIRIQGMNAGTVCNAKGQFQVSLKQANYTFIFSYIGHKFISQNLYLEKDSNIIVTLYPHEIYLSEVLVDGEDPAYPIVREAIHQKKRSNQYIHSYKARVYTKDTFGSDTALALISEAYSDLYWNKNDTLKELIIYRRQSSNLPKEYQFASANDFINFNSDSIHYWRYTFVGPIADSAFQFYAFRLIQTISEKKKKYYSIEVIPQSKLLPLFSGTITIEDSSYALVQVKLSPNNIFKIPFFDFKKFTISQQFSVYDKLYWFPLNYQITAEMKFQYMLINLPQKLYYNKSVICFEYQPNVNVNDSIKNIPTRTILPSAKTYDTLLWSNVRIYPLSDFENRSYEIIENKMKAMPFSLKALMFLRDNHKFIEMVDLRYNRVEGLYVGGLLNKELYANIRMRGRMGYGFSDTEIKYSVQPDALIYSAMSKKQAE